jgi:hypothetical protein
VKRSAPNDTKFIHDARQSNKKLGKGKVGSPQKGTRNTKGYPQARIPLHEGHDPTVREGASPEEVNLLCLLYFFVAKKGATRICSLPHHTARPLARKGYSLAVARLTRTPPFVVNAFTIGPPAPKSTVSAFVI